MIPDLPKGGRGNKAPYETTHYRIPVPLKYLFSRLSEAWKGAVVADRPEDFVISFDDKEWRISPSSLEVWPVVGSPPLDSHKPMPVRLSQLKVLKLKKNDVIKVSELIEMGLIEDDRVS